MPMDWLNYNHLLYFWSVAKEGSVSAACRRLHLAQPTVSGQIRVLETALGHKLFERRGRGLALTEMGRTVFKYADAIFTIGMELIDTVRGRDSAGGVLVRVGVADVLPKLVVYRMLLPVLSLPERVRMICLEGKLEDLARRLAVHEVDVVLCDTPLPTHANVAAYNHRLGESGLVVFGTRRLADEHRRDFPGSLRDAPFLLPTRNTAVRRAFDHWLDTQGLRVSVRGEFEDSALLKVFGQSGAGLFLAPRIIEAEIKEQYRVRVVGRLPAVKEQFYAVSTERRIKHPAVSALTDAARARLSTAG
jgi:LysR family transcriptional activator of nhaA